MAHTLVFDALYEYDAGKEGITVPVVLETGRKSVKLLAKLDTGASSCIFKREYGEELGMDIESGKEQRFGTATDSFLAYGHDLQLSALGFRFDTTVYFAAMREFPRNVLGRHGWIQQLRLGIVDYEGKLYASNYSDVI